jgi:hypothetical protein
MIWIQIQTSASQWLITIKPMNWLLSFSAFLTTTHLINRTPSKKLDYDTPLHRLLRPTADYTNLHIFRCACWPNLRPYASHKLQYCSARCMFLGYSNMHKGYQCLDSTSGGVCISRDVFDESLFPFATLLRQCGSLVYLWGLAYPITHPTPGQFRITCE